MHAEINDPVSRGNRTLVGNKVDDIRSLDNAHNCKASLLVTRVE
jgi:hypothetical protein